jgi:hypothetical protein
MISDKEIPSEYVSIRHIWLKGIDDCRKAISQVANIEASSDARYELDAGPRTVAHTVDALYLSLVDYGEAMIKTDVDKWKDRVYFPRNSKIWAKKIKEEQTQFTVFDDTGDDSKELSNTERWWAQFKLSKELYEHIIKVLNKYGMLFESQPKGYSNTEMESI